VRGPSHRLLFTLAVALAATLALTALGVAKARKMQSTKLGPMLCETTYGGKFVDIPDFPGEKIDRRLLADIKYLRSRYPIFITDGHSRDPVHSIHGEHPLGLALDIVPNKAAGGSWNDVDRLAAWAEPRQDHPREPFRWVGYDGDANHGRGHHLHISWNHSNTKPFRPATTVYTVRCPSPFPIKPPKPPEPPTGGTTVGEGEGAGDPSVGNSGGLGGKRAAPPPVIETDGVDLGE
jgi:hypothetical protein